VALSRLSFLEQAAIFYTSDIIVGEHGSGLANLVFCREGTKVIEIFNAFWMYPCFYAIARSVGLEYHSYVAGSEQVCARVAERIASRPIDNSFVDRDKSSEYNVDVANLRVKVLDVMQSNMIE
jgi:capsular polysaccharide biosynthesis protein